MKIDVYIILDRNITRSFSIEIDSVWMNYFQINVINGVECLESIQLNDMTENKSFVASILDVDDYRVKMNYTYHHSSIVPIKILTHINIQFFQSEKADYIVWNRKNKIKNLLSELS